jgi:hypothetical protein
MKHDDEENLFAPPKSTELPDAHADPSAAPRPGLLAILLISILTVLAGSCTFFCSCFGIGIMLGQLTGELTILFAFVGGMAAAIFVAGATRSGLTQLFTPEDRKND